MGISMMQPCGHWLNEEQIHLKECPVCKSNREEWMKKPWLERNWHWFLLIGFITCCIELL